MRRFFFEKIYNGILKRDSIVKFLGVLECGFASVGKLNVGVRFVGFAPTNMRFCKSFLVG